MSDNLSPSGSQGNMSDYQHLAVKVTCQTISIWQSGQYIRLSASGSQSNMSDYVRLSASGSQGNMSDYQHLAVRTIYQTISMWQHPSATCQKNLKIFRPLSFSVLLHLISTLTIMLSNPLESCILNPLSLSALFL